MRKKHGSGIYFYRCLRDSLRNARERGGISLTAEPSYEVHQTNAAGAILLPNHLQ